MRVRVLFPSVTLLALVVAPAQAQNPPMRGPGRRMQMLLQGIALSAGQQQQVDSIQRRYRDEMPSFTPGSPPDSATRERIRGLFRHEVDDIRAVLTADQQKTFDKNVAEMRERRRGGP